MTLKFQNIDIIKDKANEFKNKKNIIMAKFRKRIRHSKIFQMSQSKKFNINW